MRKNIQIAGKTYALATNAYTPIAYKEQFGKDYFQDLFQMLSAESLMKQLHQKECDGAIEPDQVDLSILSDFDMTFFHRLFWVFAKSANPRIQPYEEFFMAMEEFPLQVVGPVLMEMLNQGMTTRKKQMTARQRAKKSSR